MCLHDLCLSVSNGKLGSGCPRMIIAVWCSPVEACTAAQKIKAEGRQCEVEGFQAGHAIEKDSTACLLEPQLECVEKVQLHRNKDF